MKKITFCAFFLAFSTYVFSQTTKNFRLSGGVDIMTAETESSERVFQSSFYTPLDDTYSLRQQSEYRSTIMTLYKPKLGYSLMGTFQIPLRQNLQLSTGLGLTYSKFTYEQEYSFGSSTPIGLPDTVLTPEPITPICTNFTNSLDNSFFSQGPSYQILHLMLPLNLEYSILGDKLKLYGGIFLQTPLFSNIQTDSYNIETELINGENWCTYVPTHTEDKSGNGLRNALFGFSAGLRYQVYKNWDVHVGMRKVNSNVFTSNPLSALFSGFVQTDVLKPTFFTLGMAYTFGKKAD